MQECVQRVLARVAAADTRTLRALGVNAEDHTRLLRAQHPQQGSKASRDDAGRG